MRLSTLVLPVHVLDMDIMSNFEALGAAQNITMNKKALVTIGDLN